MSVLIHRAGWKGGRHGWGSLIRWIFASVRLAAVLRGGLSRRKSAAQFGVGISTVINWVRRISGHGQRGARPDGRAQAQGDCRRACRSFWRGASGKAGSRCAGSARTRRARPQGRLSIGVELRPRRKAQLQKKPSSPANAIDPTSRGGASSGRNVRAGSTVSAWCSSTRRGRRPTWRRCEDGRRAARLVAKVPHGHWKTMTFVAALRHDRIEAPWILDGPINAEGFKPMSRKCWPPPSSQATW